MARKSLVIAAASQTSARASLVTAAAPPATTPAPPPPKASMMMTNKKLTSMNQMVTPVKAAVPPRPTIRQALKTSAAQPPAHTPETTNSADDAQELHSQ